MRDFYKFVNWCLTTSVMSTLVIFRKRFNLFISRVRGTEGGRERNINA